ncbi:BglII/BstYI family type II restriction endonuclease [Shimia sp. SDUM112013]|uniref:BglII/BstYI family type II restriction endonuclease n=1 Tax=Shimia sp. SDUM112013 TaxID=3136160 RepID=UPI0032EBD6B2
MKIGEVYSHLNGLEWLMVRREGYWQSLQRVISAVDASACKTHTVGGAKGNGRRAYSPPALNRQFKTAMEVEGWSNASARTFYVCRNSDVNLEVLDMERAAQREIAETQRLLDLKTHQLKQSQAGSQSQVDTIVELRREVQELEREIRDGRKSMRGQQKALIESYGLDAIQTSNSSDFEKDRVSVEVQLGKYFAVTFDLFVKHTADYIHNRIDLGIEIVPMKSMEVEMSSGPPFFEKHLHEINRQGRIFPPVPLVLIGIEP